MSNFVMLTRLRGRSPAQPPCMGMDGALAEAIGDAAPGVHWIDSYAVLGPYDYMDVFSAPDVETAMKVAVAVRGRLDADTQTWPLTPCDRFQELAREVAAIGDPAGREDAPPDRLEDGLI